LIPDSNEEETFWSQTLQEMQISSGDMILLETKTGKGEWRMKLPEKLESVTPSEWKSLKIGATLDVKDFQGKWYKAEILKRDESRNAIFVHYQGFSSKWDDWIDSALICECEAKKCSCKNRLAAPGFHSTPIASMTRTSIRRSSREFSRAENVAGRPADVGATGLQNLGNTCFMNSILQCLSNTPVLTNYFLDGRYKPDINKLNPLGMKGFLAEAYAELLKTLWSGDYRSIAPTAFKRTIGSFAPRFSGYEQHDSQEFLSFVLDGLHEDLNRVRAKPYTKAVEVNSRPDSEVAEESWKCHLLRNQSVIVDLCQGQLKSTIVCPSCNFVSVTFDPFMYLSVPLPSFTTKKLSVMLFYQQGSTPPTKFCVSVPLGKTLEDVSDELSKMAGIRYENIVLSENWKNMVYRVLSNKQSVDVFRKDDMIYAYEQDEQLLSGSEKEWIYIQASHRIRVSSSQKLSETCISSPLLLALNPKQSNKVIRESLIARLRYWFSDSDSGEPFEIRIMNLKQDSCGICKPSSLCSGCILSPDDAETRLHSRTSLVVVWNEEWSDKIKEKDKMVRAHSSALEPEKIGAEITLDDCIQSFTQTEKLGKDDAWYCSKCKEFRQATKKFDLWKFPEILIIHLKRFQTLGHFRYLSVIDSILSWTREKITALVRFPVSGLDLSKYTLDSADSKPVYDIYATSVDMSSGFTTNFDRITWEVFLGDTTLHTRGISSPESGISLMTVMFQKLQPNPLFPTLHMFCSTPEDTKHSSDPFPIPL
jgi:ubiquitin carboxyl-terminal hydrolase 4/11/15